MSRLFVLTRWINPWFLICCVAHEFCIYKAGKWYTAGHPHWDCVAGKAFEWSIKKYGQRPQDVFYKRWEDRRRFFAERISLTHRTFKRSTIEKFRREYGIPEREAAKGGEA